MRGSRPIAPSALARLCRAVTELEASNAHVRFSPRLGLPRCSHIARRCPRFFVCGHPLWHGRHDPPNDSDRDAFAHGELAPRSDVPRSHIPEHGSLRRSSAPFPHCRTSRRFLGGRAMPACWPCHSCAQRTKRAPTTTARPQNDFVFSSSHAVGATCDKGPVAAMTCWQGRRHSNEASGPAHSRTPASCPWPPKPDEVLAAERREPACANVGMGKPSSPDSGRARTRHGGHLPRPGKPGATAPGCAITNPARSPGARPGRPGAALCMGRRDGVAGSTQRRSARAVRHAC